MSNIFAHWQLHIIYQRNVQVNVRLQFIKGIYDILSSHKLWSSPRPISIGQLHALLHFHLRPINLVVYKGSYYLMIWDILSWGRFHAYMLSAFILSILRYPAMPLARQLMHNRYVHSGPCVLGAGPLKYLTPTMDRDRTVSRRSEPSSRAILIGEQPNPWDQLQPQDMTSRHRGAKPHRRCERLGGISLLSPR